MERHVIFHEINKKYGPELDELNAAYDIRAQITSDMLRKAQNSREEQIKERLRERGIKLDTPAAFVHVLKTRCRAAW